MKKIFVTIELFLVVLVLLLVGFLFFIFIDKKNEKSTIVTPTVDTSELYCGITITNPKINSVVNIPFTISGYISGCGWERYLDYVARLKLLDGGGKKIGRPFLISQNKNNISPVSSQFSFEIKNLPVSSDEKINLVFQSMSAPENTFTLPVVLEKKIQAQNE